MDSLQYIGAHFVQWILQSSGEKKFRSCLLVMLSQQHFESYLLRVVQCNISQSLQKNIDVPMDSATQKENEAAHAQQKARKIDFPHGVAQLYFQNLAMDIQIPILAASRLHRYFVSLTRHNLRYYRQCECRRGGHDFSTPGSLFFHLHSDQGSTLAECSRMLNRRPCRPKCHQLYFIFDLMIDRRTTEWFSTTDWFSLPKHFVLFVNHVMIWVSITFL